MSQIKDLKGDEIDDLDVGNMKEKEFKKKSKKEEKINYTANFNGLVDIVNDDGQARFLTVEGELLDKIEIDNKIYYPPSKLGWFLPRASEVLNEVKKHDTLDTSASQQGCTYCQSYIYPYTFDYFKQFSDPPTDLHRHYLVWMDFHSYLIEKFNFSPILFLVATKDRGKTPTLKAMAYSCYRGKYTETFREPNLIRWSSDYNASMFFDVKDFPKKVELANCEDLIFGRAERGVIASRVLFPEKGAFNDMVDFEVFGVTGATSNVMVDSITEARCIVFNMPLSKRVFDMEPSREMGLEVREKLTAFRMAHLRTPFVDIKKEKIGKLENYLKGYHQMIKTIFPKYEDEFIKFKELMEKQKKEEAEGTFEGKLLLSIVNLKDNVENGTLFLSTEDITNEFNKNRPERYHVSTDTIGSDLKALGFKMKRNSLSTKRGIFFDTDLINTLGDQFNIDTKALKVDPLQQSGVSDEDIEGVFG